MFAVLEFHLTGSHLCFRRTYEHRFVRALISTTRFPKKRDFSHINFDEQRLFHELVIALIRVHATTGRHNDPVHVTVVEGVIESGGAPKDVHRVVVPGEAVRRGRSRRWMRSSP
jgi:hypothetical protein